MYVSLCLRNKLGGISMKNLNYILPKIPNMKWSALINTFPTNAKLKQLDKLLPHDGSWHTVIESKGMVDVDGITIRRKTTQSMT